MTGHFALNVLAESLYILILNIRSVNINKSFIYSTNKNKPIIFMLQEKALNKSRNITISYYINKRDINMPYFVLCNNQSFEDSRPLTGSLSPQALIKLINI